MKRLLLFFLSVLPVRMKGIQGSRVINLRFTGMASDVIDGLIEKTEADGAAQVVARAIRLYATLVDEVKEKDMRILTTSGLVKVIQLWKDRPPNNESNVIRLWEDE